VENQVNFHLQKSTSHFKPPIKSYGQSSHRGLKGHFHTIYTWCKMGSERDNSYLFLLVGLCLEFIHIGFFVKKWKSRIRWTVLGCNRCVVSRLLQRTISMQEYYGLRWKYLSHLHTHSFPIQPLSALEPQIWPPNFERCPCLTIIIFSTI